MKYITLYLFFVFVTVDTAFVLQTYCYNDPELSCAEKHVLDCTEDQVITIDLNFGVGFLKNTNFPECRTNAGECKNKTTCCRYISNSVTRQVTGLKADNTSNPLIDFIKTNCSSKSSCTVENYYNNNGDPDIYDYVRYRYYCIAVKTDDITVDFMVNGSTKFTRNRFIYFLDYTGTKGDNNFIVNRECVVSNTPYISLTINKLNLQADDCCRFQITGFNVSEYCSENGSMVPIRGKYIGRKTATIKLENVAYKDGDSFLIIIEVGGNVTIDCRTIEDVDRQEISTCLNPTSQSTTTIRTSTPTTSISTEAGESITDRKEVDEQGTTSISTEATATDGEGVAITDRKEVDEQGTYYSGHKLAVIIGGIVGGLVFLNIIFIIIVVLCVRKKLSEKTTDESQHYATLDDSRRSVEYVDMTTTSTPTREYITPI